MQKKSFEHIRYGAKLIAIILRAGYRASETIFFSPPEFPQQLGCIVYKKGGTIGSHLHKAVQRKVSRTQEVLFIKKGKVLVNFYNTNKKFIVSKRLKAGDMVFLCDGGHGFRMLEDSEIIEVKQGPYLGKISDKELFQGSRK